MTDLLDAFRTGELEPGPSAAVEAHLRLCAECVRSLAETESLARVAADAFAITSPANGRGEADWDRQRREILSRISGLPSPATQRIALRYVPAAALAVLALLVVGILARQEVHSPADAERRLSRPAEASRSDLPVPADRPSDEPPRPPVSNDAPVRERSRPSSEPRRREDTFANPAPRPDQQADAKQSAARAAGQQPRDAQEAAPGASLRDGHTSPERGRRSGEEALRRFEMDARRALAAGDRELAGRVLALWRDGLASGAALLPAERAAAAALADSLGALYDTRPRWPGGSSE